jgi:predicted phage terminase large subunit-like protein
MPTESQIQRAASLLAQTSLYFYARLMMNEARGQTWLKADHHPLICSALERVFRGECRRLIINIPPRYSKTELALMFMTWTLGHVPDAEFIYTSYSARLAATQSWKARELVKHEAYARVFPGVAIDISSSARDEWRTLAGGCVYAAGSGGSITGYGAGKMRPGFGGAIIIDDSLKADEARSEVTRPGVIEWFQNTIESRTNSPHTPIIAISQRLHEEDLPGWLLAGGNGEEWDSIILPAIRDDGTALWPEKHTIDELRRMERASPYVFAGQYLQRPAPLAGGVFKPGEMRELLVRPRIIDGVRGWDQAATVDGGDRTEGVLIGRTAEGRFVIMDIQTLQGGPDEVQRLIVDTATHDGVGVRVGLAQDPGSAGLAWLSCLTKALAGFTVAASPEYGDKIDRALPFASQVNLGNVDYVRGEWALDLINQMRNFPNAKHDDKIDACSRAFNTLTDKPAPMKFTEEFMQRIATSTRRRPRL